MKVAHLIFYGVVCGLIANFQANAAQLILPTPGSSAPNFYDSPLDVVYNSSSQIFGVTNYTGSLSEYNNGAGASIFQYEDESYLTATITTNGAMLTGGTFDLYGNIGSGDNELLLAGTLVTGASGTAWGYYDNNSVDQFTFKFKITGGATVVENDFGGVGATDGIDLYAEFSSNSGHDTPFTGTWGPGVSFNNLKNNQAGYGLGYDDIFAVPEPSSMTLISVAAGLSALTLIYRRKSKVQPAPCQIRK